MENKINVAEITLNDMFFYCINQVQILSDKRSQFDYYLLLNCLTRISEEDFEKCKEKFNIDVCENK